jgi:adenylate cyclase
VDTLISNNRIALQPLDSHKQGGYNLKNLDGYQVLLNYRLFNLPNNNFYLVPNDKSPYNIARTVTVEEILNKKIPKKLIQGKIVLIGITAVSYDNVSPIPLLTNKEGDQQMWGLYIQAQKLSQIVSAAEGTRRLPTAGSLEYEILCILICALMGAILPHLCQGTRKLIMVGGILIIVLYTMSLVFFISPIKLWIPVNSSVMALFLSGGIVVFIEFNFQNNQNKPKFT